MDEPASVPSGRSRRRAIDELGSFGRSGVDFSRTPFAEGKTMAEHTFFLGGPDARGIEHAPLLRRRG